MRLRRAVGTVGKYVRTGETWTKQAELPIKEIQDNPISGDGNTIILDRESEPFDPVFVRTGETWSEEGTLPGGGSFVR